jgi:hypothetical protein
MGRKVGWLISILLLGVTGVLGVNNSISEWPDAQTPLQKSVMIGVFLYGVFGIAGAVGLALRKRWSYVPVLAWGIAVTYVPAAAVLAYAPDGNWASALPGSVASGLIAVGIAWATRANTRTQTTMRSET